MDINLTGTEIVAAIANGKPWWRLSAGDVAPWVKSLHLSAIEDSLSRTEFIGDAWDGPSDIQVGHRRVAASDMKKLLIRLVRGIRRLGNTRIAPPDPRSFRRCFVSVGGREALAIDIDMGDFILPICVEERSINATGGLNSATVAAGMIFQIIKVDAMRDRILSRELRLRRALETMAAGIGAGVAPLFLRMAPYPFDESPKHIPHSDYVMLVVTLNDCLGWSPVGTERVSTVKNVRAYRSFYAMKHRPRAAALANLRETGSGGMVCRVTLAFIREQGHDPVHVFDQAYKIALRERFGVAKLSREGSALRIFYYDGMLRSSFDFDSGRYRTGSLTLWGSYPETYAIGAIRRPLTAYVDHPAFRAAGVKVRKCKIHEDALDLHHVIRALPIEAFGDASIASNTLPATRPAGFFNGRPFP